MKKELYLKIRPQLQFKFSKPQFYSQIAIDLSLLLTIAFLLHLESSVAWLATGLIAVLMLRNVSSMHEAVHGLAHPNPQLNEALGILTGTLCLLPFSLWRKIHLEHHFWAGNYHRDPALEIIKRYPQMSQLQKALLNFSWKTRFPLTAFVQYLVFWGHSAVRLAKDQKNISPWINLLFPLSLWTVTVMTLNPYQALILGSGVFLYLILFEVINFPHHVGLYLENSETARLPVWEQYQVTRSSRYPTWIEKLLVLNFNYHTEHHLFPDLPWHELPKAHALLQSSEIQARTHVVRELWLRQKRQGSFQAFLRPDLTNHSPEKKRTAA